MEASSANALQNVSDENLEHYFKEPEINGSNYDTNGHHATNNVSMIVERGDVDGEQASVAANNCNKHLKRLGKSLDNSRHSHQHSHSHNDDHHHMHSLRRVSEIPKMNEAELDEIEKETYHFHKIVATFKVYRKLSMDKLSGTERYIKSLPPRHQELLSDYLNHLKEMQSCVDVNQNLFQLFVHEETNLFENQDEYYPTGTGKSLRPIEQQVTSVDFDRLQAVLKHIVRDWSEIGEKERKSSYAPIIAELESQFPDIEKRNKIKVLVPGAGLGRLTHEIVRRGFETQGNEFSLLMLFASNFILNKCFGKNIYKCFPWVHQNTNVVFHKDQMREVMFPDINPTNLPEDVRLRFSMTAGDFLEVYGRPDEKAAWDCIATCFFIDCAHNIVAFIEQIYNCLKENGIWINLGPLLYHYADIPDEMSIEPPYNFVISIAKKLGFAVEKETLDLPTYYTENSLSMLNYCYKSVFFVCRKLPVTTLLDSNEHC